MLTIEGLAERPEFARLEAAFTRHAALQCGFCTPGMLLTVAALLETGELTSARGRSSRSAQRQPLSLHAAIAASVEAVCDLAGARTWRR